MIKISGTTIKSPSTFNVKVEDIKRKVQNANGKNIIQKIGTRRTISLSYKVITSVELKVIYDLITDGYFNVEYPDPKTGNLRTGSFTSESIDNEVLLYISNSPLWSSITIELEEE